MTKNSNTWTVLNLLKTTTDYFNKHHIENPRLNAERLLAHVLNLERIQLYLQFERILSESELKKYRILVQQRAEHKPLQYLIGMTEFMGITFKVTPDVLIPRPETEILIEKTLLHKDRFADKNIYIWDIGTGSGCIAVSLAYYWPTCRIIATDVSSRALTVAEENAKLNGTEDRISFIQHDILKDEPMNYEKIDIIISNPPYIGKRDLKKLDKEIYQFEPEIALTDYRNGLEFYKKILSLNREGVTCKLIILELSGIMNKEIINIAESYNFKKINVYNDLNNIPRVLEIILS